MIQVTLRYEIVRKLGTGTVAKSYAAIERGEHGLARPVTLKRLEGEDVSPIRLATLRELGVSHHNGLLLPRALLVDGGGVAVVYDHVVGRSLVGLIAQCVRQKRPLAEQAATTFFARAAESVADLHEGWLGSTSTAHGAIRPSNLLFSLLGGLWVDDAGLAADPCELARRGTLTLGQVHFAAPEALEASIRGAESLEHREARANDVYGLAACLYTLVTLRLPFEETEIDELLARKQHDAPTPARQVNPRVSEELEALLMTALAPAGPRPRARVLAQALRRLIRTEDASPARELRALLDDESLAQHQALVDRCRPSHEDSASDDQLRPSKSERARQVGRAPSGPMLPLPPIVEEAMHKEKTVRRQISAHQLDTSAMRSAEMATAASFTEAVTRVDDVEELPLENILSESEIDLESIRGELFSEGPVTEEIGPLATEASLPDGDDLVTDVENGDGLDPKDSLETDPPYTVVAAAEDIIDMTERTPSLPEKKRKR